VPGVADETLRFFSPASLFALSFSRDCLMSNATLKHLLLSATPGFLKPYWHRLEASPLGYRLAKGAFWSLVGTVLSRSLSVIASILVARMLGKVGMGELGIIQNTVAAFNFSSVGEWFAHDIDNARFGPLVCPAHNSGPASGSLAEVRVRPLAARGD
jgi:hypothetical protein